MTGEPHVATVLFTVGRFSQEAVNPHGKTPSSAFALGNIFNEIGRAIYWTCVSRDTLLVGPP
jgi:hypothetical protein